MIIKQKLDLNYTLSFGKMTRWVIGLSEGKAIALKCSQCEKSSFPPQRICDCRSSKNEWIELNGKANILVKTSGVDGDFAIAKFEGSDNSAVVRLKGFKINEINGKISSCNLSQPSLNLMPIKSGNE